jgi:hypothetical protein
MLRALAVGLTVLLFLLAGCAQMPGGKVDNERLRNAIAGDEVGYLREAVSSGRVGANQRIPVTGYLEGTPLITIAARYGSLGVLRFLISAGADVNARTPAGETAVMLASYFSFDSGERSSASAERYERAVRILVEAGASLENDPHHYTALSYAAYQGNDRIVRYLIERGARVDADAEGGMIYINTPLMMAAIQGHMDTAMWLLRSGADARVRIYRGNTAAELAQKYNHGSLIRTLRCAERLEPGEKFAQKCPGR